MPRYRVTVLVPKTYHITAPDAEEARRQAGAKLFHIHGPVNHGIDSTQASYINNKLAPHNYKMLQAMPKIISIQKLYE